MTLSAVADEKKTSEPSSASAAFNEGVELFNTEKHEEAASAFRRAYELKPSWKLQYNIGQCEAALTRYGLAIEAFEAYLGQGGDEVPVDRRDEVLGELDRMRKMVGGIKIKGPDGVEIYVDDVLRGQTPINASILVTAGISHSIVLKKDGAEVLSLNETVRGSDTMALTVPEEEAPEASETAETVPSPEPPAEELLVSSPPPSATYDNTPEPLPVPVPRPERKGISPALFWVGAGVMVAFGGTSLGLALAADSRWETAEKDLGDNPWTFDAGDLDAIRLMQVASYACMGLGGAGLIMMIVALPITRWRRGESQAVALRPWSTSNSGGFVIEGRF